MEGQGLLVVAATGMNWTDSRPLGRLAECPPSRYVRRRPCPVESGELVESELPDANHSQWQRTHDVDQQIICAHWRRWCMAAPDPSFCDHPCHPPDHYPHPFPYQCLVLAYHFPTTGVALSHPHLPLVFGRESALYNLPPNSIRSCST